VTLENVPAYQRSKSWQIISTALSIAGYSVEAEIVNAYDFGNPQGRKRFIVRAGLRVVEPLAPVTQKTCWSDVLLPMHVKMTTLSKGQAKEFELTQPTHGFYLAQRTGYSVKNGPQVIGVDRPCFTITAAMAHDGKKNKSGLPSFRSPATAILWGKYCTAWELRARELAALQGFPDNWVWPGAESTAAKSIGNAVPVQLAKAIGLSLLT
jgi:DNA (cytosine-5)-methyltransferase 1